MASFGGCPSHDVNLLLKESRCCMYIMDLCSHSTHEVKCSYCTLPSSHPSPSTTTLAFYHDFTHTHTHTHTYTPTHLPTHTGDAHVNKVGR